MALISLPSVAIAEYRAFELQIDDTETSKSRLVISTLDQLQYPKYYPLHKSETIKYNDSWMCRENMSEFRKTCTKPDRAPTSAKPSSTNPSTATTSPAPKAGKGP